MFNNKFRAAAITLIFCTVSAGANATTLYFSTTSPASVPGPGAPSTNFAANDVVRFNNNAGYGSIYLLDDTINDGGLSNMNALYVRNNGNIIFSVQSGTVDYAYDDHQLAEYNPTTDTLSLFYDFSGLITNNTDVDIGGFHLLGNGNFLLVNTQDFTMDGQNFKNGDVVEFNPTTGDATLFFSEALFAGSDDIWVRSVSRRANGNLVLSAFNEDTGGAITLGGLTFGRGDVVEYNLDTDTAVLLFDSANFGGATEDIDAVHVIPVPPSVWLMISAIGLLGLTRRRFT